MVFDPRAGSFATGSTYSEAGGGNNFSSQTSSSKSPGATKSPSSSSSGSKSISSSTTKSPGATKSPSTSSSTSKITSSSSTKKTTTGFPSGKPDSGKDDSKPSSSSSTKKTQQPSFPSSTKTPQSSSSSSKTTQPPVAAPPPVVPKQTFFQQPSAASSAPVTYADLANFNTYDPSQPGERMLLDMALGQVPSRPMSVFDLPPLQGPNLPEPEEETSIAERYYLNPLGNLPPLSDFEAVMGGGPLGAPIPQSAPQPIPQSAPYDPQRMMGINETPGLGFPEMRMFSDGPAVVSNADAGILSQPENLAMRAANARSELGMPPAPQDTIDDHLSSSPVPVPRPAGRGGLGGMSVSEFNETPTPESAFLPGGFGAETSPRPQMRPVQEMRPQMRPPQSVDNLGYSQFGRRDYGQPITPYTTFDGLPTVPGALAGTAPGAVPTDPAVPVAGALPSSQLPPAPVSMSGMSNPFLEEILPGSPGVRGAGALQQGVGALRIPSDLDTSTPVAGNAPLRVDAQGYPLPGPGPEATVSPPPLFFGGSLNSAAGQAPAVGGDVGGAPARPTPASLGPQMRNAAPLGSRTPPPPPNMDFRLSTAAPDLSAPPVPSGGIGSLPMASDDRYAASVPGFSLADQAPEAAPQRGAPLPPVQGPSMPLTAPDRSFMGPDTTAQRASVAEQYAPQMDITNQDVQVLADAQGSLIDDYLRAVAEDAAYVRDQELRQSRPVPRPAVPAPDRAFMGPGTVSDRAATAAQMRPQVDQYMQTEAPYFMDDPFLDFAPSDSAAPFLPPLPDRASASEPTATEALAAARAAEQEQALAEAQERIADIQRGDTGLQASSSGSSLAPTPANIAADAAAGQAGIAEGSVAPVIGGPTIGGQLLAAGINAANPLLRGQDTGDGFLGRITGGRPLFGEDGVIPPSDPFTIDDFLAAQADSESDGSDRRVAAAKDTPVISDVASDDTSADAAAIPSVGQYGDLGYSEAPPVTLPSGYSMSLEDYLALLARMPGGSESAGTGLLTVTPLNLGIGSLT